MIAPCKSACKHPSQDELHGKGKRVLNEVPAKEKGATTYRCTVCGTVHSSNAN